MYKPQLSLIFLIPFIIQCQQVVDTVTTKKVEAQQSLPKIPPTMKLGDPLPQNLFVELAKIINPAVVNISTSVVPKRGQYYRDPMLDMMEEFFGGRVQPRNRPDNKPRQMGLGTGFIIRDDGLIVTNNHVIAGADIINVQLTEDNDKLYEATLIGSDERSDIALIKIKAEKKLPVAVLGSSKDLQVGEWVAAFGNPFGHGHSMTKGIISSKGRSLEEINKIPLLQTDASINPGNSGGPLVDARGFVIGVNSAIDARAQGIGFAIPIDEVKQMIPQLESRGKVRKGFIGVTPQNLDPETAAYIGQPEAQGAIIMDMVEDGPAANSGLRVYDIITEFNGKKIKNSVDLIDAVADAPIGQKSVAKILRGSKKLEINIAVKERDDNTLALKRKPLKDKIEGEKITNNFGAKVIDLTSQQKQEWGIPSVIQNPMIIEIERNSLAERIGLRVGDIVLDVNKNETSKAKDVSKFFQKGFNTIRIARGTSVKIFSFEN